MSCSVCFDPFNRTTRAVTQCPYCAIQTCRTCLQTYLLTDIGDIPRCINPECGHGYSREFLDGELTQAFRLKTYKAHREKVLSDRERARFPSTQADVRAYLAAKARATALREEIAALSARIFELHAEFIRRRTVLLAVPSVDDDAPSHGHADRPTLSTTFQLFDQYVAATRPIHRQRQALRRELNPLRRTIASYGRFINARTRLVAQDATTPPTRNEFIKPCPSNECKGFLSTSWKCGLCDVWSCPTCHEVKGLSRDAAHSCDPDKVLTVQFLAKVAKSCPKCGVQICKIEGCDQMWCTSCNTGFDWRTGKLANGPIHNPHYFEWLRSRGEAPPNSAQLVNFGDCDVVTDRAVAEALRGTTDATEPFLLQTWRLMRELQDDRGFRVQTAMDEKFRQLRVRYMANELTEAAWKRTLQRYEKDANFHAANHNVKDVFVTASRDLIRNVLDPGADLSLVKEQLVALFAYCNAASDAVSKRFMRRARVYALRAPNDRPIEM